MNGTERAAYAVMACVIALVAGSFVVAATDDASEPTVTIGDVTVSGSLAREGVTVDEYGGVATLTYENGGSVRWFVANLEVSSYRNVMGIIVPDTFHTQPIFGSSLEIDTPGRYNVTLEAGGGTRTGTVTLLGDVTKTYSWTQTFTDGTYREYSADLTFGFSDYLRYADDASAVRHTSERLDDSRYAVVDDTLTGIEKTLKAEYLRVNGQSASVDGQAYADYLLSFVQCCIDYPPTISRTSGGGVEYDEDGSGDLWLYGQEEYWAYPLETIYRGQGDCEDTCFLAAALFSSAGYTSAVAAITGHMLAAVCLDEFTPVPGYNAVLTVKKLDATGENIYFCETTTDRFVAAGYIDEEASKEVAALERVSVVERTDIA